jgi:hypothetical protein
MQYCNLSKLLDTFFRCIDSVLNTLKIYDKDFSVDNFERVIPEIRNALLPLFREGYAMFHVGATECEKGGFVDEHFNYVGRMYTFFTNLIPDNQSILGRIHPEKYEKIIEEIRQAVSQHKSLNESITHCPVALRKGLPVMHKIILQRTLEEIHRTEKEGSLSTG